jgi:hypothetical protein
MPAQSFGGGAAARGGGSAPAGAPAAGASSGGGAAPPRQQRVRARRGQATDPHSIAERVRHSPTTFPFSLHFLMPASLYPSCALVPGAPQFSDASLTSHRPQFHSPLLQFKLQSLATNFGFSVQIQQRIRDEL